MAKIKQGFSGAVGTLTPLLDAKGLPKYNKGLVWYRIPLFDYQENPGYPLIYTDTQGNQYSLDRHFETDGGSIPSLCQTIPFANLNPFNFPRAYLFHDSAYQYGGLYIKYAGETGFKFRLMTRKETDGSMPDWLYYDGANWWTRRVICTGLATGSWTVWNSKKSAKQKASRKKDGVSVYDVRGNLIEDNSKKVL